MEYTIHSFRHGEVIATEPEFRDDYNQILKVISSVSDDDIIKAFTSLQRSAKSLSEPINKLLDERLKKLGWTAQSPIFQDNQYEGERWRLDFAKNGISVEVAFNHNEATAWNLLKPVLASELNHVNKGIQTKIGVIITATVEMKRYGGFDGAVGTFENFVTYLKPLNNVLTVPMVIIGLKPPKKFSISHKKTKGKNIGSIAIK